MTLKRVALFGVAVLAGSAAIALAGTKQETDVKILEKTSWNGKELTPGAYKIAWEGDSGDVKVSVMRGRDVVAQGQGRWEERSTPASDGGILARRDSGSGSMVLSEVRMAGKKSVLVLAGS